ncbi:DedA family protein (plasmid) [Limimaricola variabilis]|jgi:membrane protein DedA with SNARE-associated domain
MTEMLLALVPTYGLWLILVAVALSCLALPVPASILVMTGGGFAAAGDLTLWQLLLAVLAGQVIGDQAAYHLARLGGAPVIARLGRGRAGPVIGRAEALIDRRGLWAVLLSRTLLSPLGPYVAYLCGALGLRWGRYSAVALAGGAIWATGYAGLGYVFAHRIAEIAALIGNALGLILAAAAVAGLGGWLLRAWRAQAGRVSAEPA